MRKVPAKILKILFLIILLAAGLRIIRALEEERYSNDAYYYFELAHDYALYGHDYVREISNDFIPPLLPTVLALGYNLNLNPDQTGLLIGILFGSLMPVAMFWIAFNLYRNNNDDNSIESENCKISKNYYFALAAALGVAIHPFLVRISVSCLREIIFLPFFLFALAFAVSATKDDCYKRWSCFALLSALATITRREGIILFLVFIVWQIIDLFFTKEAFTKQLKRKVLPFLLVASIYLLVILFFYHSLFDNIHNYVKVIGFSYI